jgi:hypothetical protein
MSHRARSPATAGIGGEANGTRLRLGDRAHANRVAEDEA